MAAVTVAVVLVRALLGLFPSPFLAMARFRPGRFALLLPLVLACSPLTITPARANPWDAGDMLISDGEDLPPLPGTSGPFATQPLSPAQLAQRCSTGRLMGGLLGGGIGYALSRQDGRAWAIPLGALLGSQMGCSAAVGNGPRPW